MNAYPNLLVALTSTFVLLACSGGGGGSDAGDGDGDATNSGGASGDGDVASGTGGAGSGGAGSGGTGTGGVGTGGVGTGGVGTGGAGTGGSGGSGSGGEVSGAGGAAADGLLFSTNFDSDPLGNVVFGGSTWTTTLPQQYDSAGIVAVVGDKSPSGNSVYVKKGNDGQAFLQLTDASVFPFTGTKIHVRAFINVPEWPANHVSWMEIGTAVNEEHELRIGAHQGVLQVNHWPGDQDQIAEGITFAINEWHCIEYSYDTTTSTLEVWLDDTKIDALTVVGAFARGGAPQGGFPPIEALRFGAEIQATEAWYDNIAVGTGPIGCN